MKQRGGHQQLLAAMTARADPRPYRPKLTVVRQRNALGTAGRTGSVKHHRRFAGLRSDGLKGAEIKEACEAINPGGIEVDQGNVRR